MTETFKMPADAKAARIVARLLKAIKEGHHTVLLALPPIEAQGEWGELESWGHNVTNGQVLGMLDSTMQSLKAERDQEVLTAEVMADAHHSSEQVSDGTFREHVEAVLQTDEPAALLHVELDGRVIFETRGLTNEGFREIISGVYANIVKAQSN